LQFRYVLFFDSATQSEYCQPAVFESSNLQHSFALSSNTSSISELLIPENLDYY
jgi:hypothetical protein